MKKVTGLNPNRKNGLTHQKTFRQGKNQRVLLRGPSSLRLTLERGPDSGVTNREEFELSKQSIVKVDPGFTNHMAVFGVRKCVPGVVSRSNFDVETKGLIFPSAIYHTT
jgi:hypothetical protein